MEIFKQITANNIVLKEYPFWKELAMEAYLLENEEILKLDGHNFSDVTIIDAEIALKQGSKSGDGRIYMLVKYSGEYLGIVEIKLKEINESSLNQLENYLNQKTQLVEKNKQYWTESTSPKWVGVLVGCDISNELRDKLSQGYAYDGIPIAGMTIKRFRSPSNEVYVISDTFFRFKYSSKDFSKFIFMKKEYNKGRLVNAVIKNYVEKNPNINYAELKSKFPDKIQGSFGVFDTKENAEDIFRRWGHKRHYINPDEEIKLFDETIATCTQWNSENINVFLDQSKKLGLFIELK